MRIVLEYDKEQNYLTDGRGNLFSGIDNIELKSFEPEPPSVSTEKLIALGAVFTPEDIVKLFEGGVI